MARRKDRLGQMMGASSRPAPARADASPERASEVSSRRRALLFAPAPAPGSAYIALLEADGFDVLVAEDLATAESLLRSAPPQLILAVAPALGSEVFESWTNLAPEAELRVIPGLLPVLEDRLVPANELLEFVVRSLCVASGIASAPRGVPGTRTSQILQLAATAAETLGLGERESIGVRLSVALGGLVAALQDDEGGAERRSTDDAERPGASRAALREVAEAVGCPFPLGEPASGPPGSRAPAPADVVDAATRLVLLREAAHANPSLALRQLSMPGENGASQLHPAAVEAVLAGSQEGRDVGAEIFLVDPEASSRNLLALRLGNEGYSVRTAMDGRRALEDIRRQSPALILSETVLPGLDGYALLDTLKREGKGTIPMIFLSSDAEPLSVNKGLLLGAADFLAKPVNFEVLLTKLEKALARDVRPCEVSARLSLSDVTRATQTEYPPIAYEELQLGVVVRGRFRIDTHLGEGGMGKVFKAWDEKLEEQVVIKVMKPGFSDDFLRRFKREIRLARKITHPGVVRIFDFFEAGELNFVTMEFLEGTDLSAELNRRGAFPIPVALRIAREIFDALATAHGVGVVHRDIKPANVLMLPSGKIKILDFGIAQALDSNSPDGSTLTTSIVGTPEYMSPEQLLGEKLDGRTDLYSTGVVLYRLLAGELPFQARDRLECARMRLTSDPQPPSAKSPTIPAEVDALVLRLLKRNRDERFPSAEAVGAELRELLR